MSNKITRLCKLIIIPALVASLTACGTTVSKGDKIGSVKDKSTKQIVKKIKKEQSNNKKSKHIKKKAKRSKKKKFNFQGDANHPLVKKSAGRLLYRRRIVAPKRGVKVKYADYNEMVLKIGEKQPKTGRYADVTKDKKVRWDKKYKDEPFSDITDLEDLTLNGKKFKFTGKFADLGGEFAIFDKVDVTKIRQEDFPLNIVDKKTGYVLNDNICVDVNSQNPYMLLYLFDEKNKCLVNVDVNKRTGVLSSFSTGFLWDGFTLFDIRLKGVGAGNTFNEIYEVLGKPNYISSREDGSKYVLYEYKNKDGKVRVSFESSSIKGVLFDEDNPFKYNVVTAVSVSIIRQDKKGIGNEKGKTSENKVK